MKHTALVKKQKAARLPLEVCAVNFAFYAPQRIDGAPELKSSQLPPLGVSVAFLSSFYRTFQRGVCAT